MNSFHIQIKKIGPLLMVVLLSLLGTGCVLSVMHYLRTPPNLLLGWIFMSFVFFIYVINRYTDQKEDFANDIHKVLFFNRNKFLYFSGLAAILSSVFILTFLSKFSWFHFFLIAIGCLYSYKLVPWYHRKEGFFLVRLKDIPLMKNLFVSLLWGTSVFAFPILFSHMPVNNPFTIGLLIGGLCLSTFSNTLFDDVLDEVGDRIAKTKTLPTLLGIKACYGILATLNFLWIGTLIWLFTQGKLDLAHNLFLISLALYPFVYIVPHHFRWWKKSMTDILMELDLLYFALGMTLLSNIV